MLCVVQAKHVSQKGPRYTRTHTLVLPCARMGPALDGAVRLAGLACHYGPSGIIPYPIPEVIYPELPVAIDPGHVIVLCGIPIRVDVPYKCTMEELIRTVIPAKLSLWGVHAWDVHGAPMCDGLATTAHDLWRDTPRAVQWTKLGVPVVLVLAPRILAGIVAIQRLWAERSLVMI